MIFREVTLRALVRTHSSCQVGAENVSALAQNNGSNVSALHTIKWKLFALREAFKTENNPFISDRRAQGHFSQFFQMKKLFGPKSKVQATSWPNLQLWGEAQLCWLPLSVHLKKEAIK